MKAPLKTTLGANLRSLMKVTHEYGSPAKLAKKIGTSKSTVERIRNGSVACQIDTLEAIAAAFDLQPWQLLIDELEPNNPPMLRRDSDRLDALYAQIKMAAEEIAQYEKGNYIHYYLSDS